MRFLLRSAATILRRLSVFALAVAMAGCGGSGAERAMILAPAIPAAEPVLLYVGTGTSSDDVSAVKAVLRTLKVGYLTADSNQLNAMTEPQLGGYKLLIVPGGNSIEIGQSLTGNTTAMIRAAVAQYGTHYLGICAGAFFGGFSIYNGVNLTSGVWFDFYADEAKGIHRAVVTLSRANSTPLEAYWQDGPQLSGWGHVVARYPDGTPSIVEGRVGKGFVMFTGVHLEAQPGWLVGMPILPPVSKDLAYAGTLVQAALQGTPLPHF